MTYQLDDDLKKHKEKYLWKGASRQDYFGFKI